MFLSLKKRSILSSPYCVCVVERERKRRRSGWPQQIEISSFSSTWWRSKLLQWCCYYTLFAILSYKIVIGFSSSYPFGLQIVGVQKDSEFLSLSLSLSLILLVPWMVESLWDSWEEVFRGCGSEVNLLILSLDFFIINFYVIMCVFFFIWWILVILVFGVLYLGLFWVW